MRKAGKFICCVLIQLIILSCNQKENNSSSIQVKKLNYPSASAIEYFNSKLYVMGDDATNLVTLDTNLNLIDSLSLFHHSDRRIPKDIKHDIEASAFSQNVLYLFGSGSLSPYRDSFLLCFIDAKVIKRLPLDELYSQLKLTALEQVNIEGATFMSGNLLLANRGNKSYPFNHIVIVDTSFWKLNSNQSIKVIPFNKQTDTTSFQGISGLCYSKLNDQLIMTVSTEDTRSSHEDGAIGKSYLWIVNNISNKLNASSLQPDKIIDLEMIDPRFKGQKIESATIIGETKEFMRLVLVSDNDDGSSTIFKISLRKE